MEEGRRSLEAGLELGIALLPGSRDREGGPLVLFPSHGEWREFPYAQVVSVLGHLAGIPDAAARSRGFTLIIDMRSAWIRHLKVCLRAIQAALFGQVHQVLIVKPEQFLEKSKINLDLLIEAYELNTQLVSVHKLTRHVELSQLPEWLGGSFGYDHKGWLGRRKRLDGALGEGHQLEGRLASAADAVSAEEWASWSGKAEGLVAELGESANRDEAAGAAELKRLLGAASAADSRAREAAKDAEAKRRSSASAQLFEHYVGAVESLLDWVQGAGAKWLLTLRELGESKDEAEQLAKEHRQLAAKTADIEAQVEELGEVSGRLASEGHPRAAEVRAKRAEAERIVGRFARRVRRQTELSERILRLQSHYDDVWRSLDALMDSVCSDLNLPSPKAAQQAAHALQQHCQDIR